MPERGDYIPLSGIAALDTERLRWEVNLPDLDLGNNIGLHVNRLEALACFSGLNSLRVVNYDSDVMPAAVHAAEPNKVQAATRMLIGSSAGTKLEVERHWLDNRWQRQKAEQVFGRQWSNGEIAVNTTGVESKAHEGESPRSAEAWADRFDKALRQGLRGLANQNLIKELGTIAALPAIELCALLGGASLGTGLEELELASFTVGNLYMLPKLYARHMQQRTRQPYRLSFVPGFNIDRVLAVQAISRTLPLVRSLPPGEAK